MISFNVEQRFLVTGASSGIGRGVALLLNELGATVVGVGRNVERLERLKADAKSPQNVFCEVKDISADVEGLPAYVKSLKEKYGKFSGLAYCAGITLNQPLQMKAYATSRQLFDVDYFAPMFIAKAFGDSRNTVGRGTSMVFISGCVAIRGERGMSDYSGAKAALIASVRSIARELAPRGIRANCISPSDIETPMTNAAKEMVAMRREGYPMGIGKVSDVANVVAFLLSGNSSWISGQNYIVDCASQLV